MEFGMKSLIPAVTFAGALVFGMATNAQQSGTAEEAKALLARAAAAVKADKASALASFNESDNQRTREKLVGYNQR